MKKLMAIILTLAMVMSLCVVPASAAGSGVTITITPDQSKVDTTTEDAIVTYTVKAQVTDTNLKVGSLTITLEPSAGLTLAEKDEDTDSAFYYQENVKLKYDKTYNKTGIFETVFSYAPKTKTFVAVGTTNDRNLNSTHGEVVLMTIMGKIAQGTTGSVTLKTTQHSYGEPSGSSASVDCDVTPATVTITKAPIESVTASVAKPVAGQALGTSVDLDGATAYTGTVKWYVGETLAVETTAKANTKYTAKITLTAGSGESFADSVTIPADYTKDSSSNSNQLVLTRTFEETGNLTAAEVTAAPTAQTGLKYNGSEHPLLGFKGNASGGTMQYRLGESGEFTTAIPMATNAGTYTVYYKAVGDGTHSDSAVGSVIAKIEPKDISSATIGTIADQSYTGGAITPDLEVKDGTATLTQNTDYTVSCTDKYVGTAELTITGKGNYTGTKGATFTITAIDQTPSFTTPKDLVKGGYSLDLRELVSNAQGEMTFTIASGTAATLNNKYTLTSTAAITGEVKINVSIAAKDVDGDGNNEYKTFNQNNAIIVNVVDKTPATLTVTQADTIYGTTLADPVYDNSGMIAGSLKVTYVGRGSTSYVENTGKPTDAGTYTVKVTYETATQILSGSADFEIQAKSISGMTVTLNKTTTVYDGNNQTVTVTVKDGASTLTKDTDYTVTGTTSGTNVNSHTVRVTGKGNYKDSVDRIWKITEKDVTLTGGINATDRSYEKDNTTVELTKETPTFTGLVGSEKLDVDIPTTGTISDANAGNGKTVTYSGVTLKNGTTGMASNYKLVSPLPTVTVNITKETAPTLADITVDQKYNVTTEQSKDIGTAGMPEDAGTLTYAKGTASMTGSVTIDSWDVDTNGKVTYKLSNGAVDDTVTLPVTITSTNYADTTVNVVIKLIKGSSGGYYYAPTTAAVPDMPMLYRGCTGDAVKTLQDKLNALGYNSGSVDGIFGAKTYAAVTAFQKANSLGVDGIVGKLTWGKLYGVSPAMPVETTTVVGRPTVSYGSRGDAVRKLQELLNALGYDCGSVDGIFGSKTKAAVLAFQKANGLGVDGIVGPLTWAKLG